MSFIKNRLAAIAILCVTSNSALADKSGLYASASVGYNTLADSRIAATIDGATGSGDGEFSGSFAGGGAVGYRFTNNFSIEGEFLYRRVDLDSANLADVGSFTEGDFANTQFNINAYYHFNLFGGDNIETYVGAGLAYVTEVDIDFESAGIENEFESDELAVELMGGARYHLWDRAFIDVGLRYLFLDEVSLTAPDNGANVVDAEYSPFMATVKFGYRF